MTIAENLAAVEARIDAACARVERDRAGVRLLPVSKTHPSAAIEEAYAAGYRRFGESRVQEVVAKAAELDLPDLSWTIIGHLQTNKARQAAELADEVQSLDSVKLALELDRRAAAAGRRLSVLIEVNTSGEASKFGVPPTEVLDFAEAVVGMDALDVHGLMTVARNTDDWDEVASEFDLLRTLQAHLRDAFGGGFDELSMGMTNDLDLAVEHGSTCVRVGTAIFGAREYPVPEDH